MTAARPTYSCTRCADRKVKCDKQDPCSACVKHGVDCVFIPWRKPQKRAKRVKDHQVLIDRLKQYEAALQDQGIDPSKLPATPDSQGVSPAVVPKESHSRGPSTTGSVSEPTTTINKAQVVQGQGRSTFVENSLWSRVVEEFHDPEDALEDSSNDTNDQDASDDDFGFVLSGLPRSSTRSRHPPPECIHQLWQIFIENIDPLTKIVHVPTLRPAIQKAASNISTISRNFEALMFAIYGAAVMSLKNEECQQRFGEPRKILLSRYISSTKAALSRAKFMSTASLAVLQALVIHLLSVRDIYEPRAVWSLTGVAVRIAQSIGFERDGIALGLPPFETEMRRRIWWLLRTHDFRTAELCGLAKFRDLDTGADSTKWPTNVNDDQLYPGMPELPTESNTLTDAMFIALRYDFASFAAARISKFRQQGKDPSDWNLDSSGIDKVEMDEACKNMEELLETKYLRYCDPSQPLHLMTMLIARSSMDLVRFLSHHPRRWASIEETPVSERQWVWKISLRLFERYNMLHTNPLLKQFAWHGAYFLQWHTLIHILDTLRAHPLTADAEKAWQLIHIAYEHNQDMIFETKKPIHVAVGNLCLKAYVSREVALQKGNLFIPPTPDFILQLRQQREAAKAKSQARDTKSNASQASVNNNQPSAGGIGSMPDPGVIYSSDASESTHPQQYTTIQPPDLGQPGGIPEGDPFWFIDGFDDGLVGNYNDVMDMNLDSMLAQGHSVEQTNTQTVNWEQWDAWLANSNLIRPLTTAQNWRPGV